MNAPLQFSCRTQWNLQTTEYAEALQTLRGTGEPFYDLTASNPTTCGFQYDEIGILRELSRPVCLEYSPDPRGFLTARQAVTQYYNDAAGTRISPEHIFLTASTSEAYSYLFRLHCNPGDEILIAQPSYPLFDYLADLDDVNLVTYPLFYDHGWNIDLASLESSITPRTRAVILVHPNNPTGHYTSFTERETLEGMCLQHGLALIVDEVFLEYAHDPVTISADAMRSFTSGEHPVLTYVLNGLSKAAGLPQMKAAWLAVFGPEPLRQQAAARLEIIADTFLSVSAPVQHALPYLLASRCHLQRQILSRMRANLAALDAVLQSSAITRLSVQGGWHVVLRVPAFSSGEELAVRLIQQQRVVVHPGYFYGFHGNGWIVVSLLPSAGEFTGGIQSLMQHFKS